MYEIWLWMLIATATPDPACLACHRERYMQGVSDGLSVLPKAASRQRRTEIRLFELRWRPYSVEPYKAASCLGFCP